MCACLCLCVYKRQRQFNFSHGRVTVKILARKTVCLGEESVSLTEDFDSHDFLIIRELAELGSDGGWEGGEFKIVIRN